jgi:hypothetical protein
MKTMAGMTRFYALRRVHCASMARWILLTMIGIAAASGCGPKSEAIPTGPDPLIATTPAGKVFEQLRSGLYQIEAGLESLEAAVLAAESAKPASAEAKSSVEEIRELLNTAGEALTEEAAVPAEKGGDVPTADARRAKLVNLVNDSLHDLRDARGIVDSLGDDSNPSPLEPVGEKIDAVIDDLLGSLEALGGKEETEE